MTNIRRNFFCVCIHICCVHDHQLCHSVYIRFVSTDPVTIIVAFNNIIEYSTAASISAVSAHPSFELVFSNSHDKIRRKKEKNFIVTAILLIWKALIHYMKYHIPWLALFLCECLCAFHSHSLSVPLSLPPSLSLHIFLYQNSAKIHTYSS